MTKHFCGTVLFEYPCGMDHASDASMLIQVCAVT